MPQSRAGYSLIELLVAMSIFAIACLATAQLMLGATRLVSENELASEAIAIAQARLEQLRNLPFADMTNGNHTDAVPSSRGGVNFSITRTVVDEPATGIKRVAVLVSWNDHGETRTYAAHSIFTQVSPNL